MAFNFNRHTAAKVTSAIAATAFLSVAAVLPQAAFSQSSPGSSGDPRVDEPGTGTRVDDPSRPATGGTSERNRNTVTPVDGSPAGGGVYSNPSGQMDNSGAGGGAGGTGTGTDQARPEQPQNRLEQYGQPGVSDPTRNREISPTSPSGTMTPGNNRSTTPNSTTPNRSTIPTPQGQNSTGTGGGAGGNTIDRQINNSTSPGSATPGAGSTNVNDGSGTTGGSGAVPGLW